MKITVIVILAILLNAVGGCATHTYYIERCDENRVCTVVKVKSRLKFEEIDLSYDGKKRIFDFNASGVTATSSPLEKMAAELIPELIKTATPIPD